jgi:tetratricopeptide (TPR) repeat protein
MNRMVGVWVVCLVLTWGPRAFAESPALGQARTLIANGKLDQAEKILRGLIRADPASFDARVMLGSALAIQGARSESIEQITEAVKLRPQSAEAYNLLGTTLSRFLETADAKTAFERAILLDPDLAEAHVNLALMLAQVRDWDGAAEHLDRALALQGNTPASAYTHYLRGKTYFAQSNAEKADAELEQAVKIRPNFAEAWSDLGWARRVLFDDSGAMQAFEKSVLLNPKDPVAQYRLGTACLRNGEAKCAVEHLRASLKWGGADKPTLYNLELALRKEGHMKEAREVHSQMEDQLQASQISSQNAVLISSLNNEGMELEKRGDFEQARAKYRMALELDPTAGGIRLNYGLSLCRLHQWHEGIAEIQEVLRLDPDDGAAARALYIAKEQAAAESKSTDRVKKQKAQVSKARPGAPMTL